MKTQLLLLVWVLLAIGCDSDSLSDVNADLNTELTIDQTPSAPFAQNGQPRARTQRSELSAFMPAGDVGGGILATGTFFPPSRGSQGQLHRKGDRLKTNIHTTGLPPGAYTLWWVIFNNPDGCQFPAPYPGSQCGGDTADLFNPATAASMLWATGRVVQSNGVGNFQAEIRVGDDLGTPGEQWILGDGLIDPQGAEVHMVVKYHGPASDDRTELYEQTHTMLGLCDTNANAVDLGPIFGVQCFDPQVVVFPTME